MFQITINYWMKITAWPFSTPPHPTCTPQKKSKEEYLFHSELPKSKLRSLTLFHHIYQTYSISSHLLKHSQSDYKSFFLKSEVLEPRNQGSQRLKATLGARALYCPRNEATKGTSPIKSRRQILNIVIIHVPNILTYYNQVFLKCAAWRNYIY